MSRNQARGEKIEGQYRRAGRSTSHRGFSGGGGGRGGGGAQPPHSSISSAGRSYRKSGNGQSKVTAASAGPGVSAGNHGAESSRGSSQVQAPAPSAAGAKPVDVSGQRSARAIPKAPSSQSAVGGSSGSAVPSTPPKGDASRGTVPLQFGSISPGIMNGMQIPARTNSAPPNLDEQKRAQDLTTGTRIGLGHEKGGMHYLDDSAPATAPTNGFLTSYLTVALAPWSSLQKLRSIVSVQSYIFSLGCESCELDKHRRATY